MGNFDVKHAKTVKSKTITLRDLLDSTSIEYYKHFLYWKNTLICTWIKPLTFYTMMWAIYTEYIN